MKRLFCFLLVLLIVVLAAGCAKNNGQAPSSSTDGGEVSSKVDGSTASFPEAAKRITSYQSTFVVLCYGDSLTEGFGAPSNEFDYPAQLNSNLNGQYKVVNAGSSGEHSLAVLTRALIRKTYLSEDIVFPAGEASVRVADTFLYCKNATDKLFYDGMGADMDINLLIINGQRYHLSRNGDEKKPFTITRETTEAALTLKKDTEAAFDFSAYYSEAHCSVVLMGNNHGRTISADELLAYYKEFADANPKSILIIPYWRDDVTERMKAEFGNRALEVKSYFLGEAFTDYSLEKSTLDEWCITKKNVIPACFKKDNQYTDVHLNEKGYKILADLVYKKGVELGYWK